VAKALDSMPDFGNQLTKETAARLGPFEFKPMDEAWAKDLIARGPY